MWSREAEAKHRINSCSFKALKTTRLHTKASRDTLRKGVAAVHKPWRSGTYPTRLVRSRRRQLLCSAPARAKRQGWAQQELAPLLCCQRRWAGKTGDWKGRSLLAPEAWHGLWLTAHELPTMKCLTASDCAVAVGAGTLQSQAVHPGEGLGFVGSRRVDGR